MVSQIAGALVRAILMAALVATPSLIGPGVNADSAQIVALVAIFAGALTLFEYASTYPGLVEFRDAPPFNRIRFITLFATVLVLSVIARSSEEPTILADLIRATGAVVGQAIDFPYSPVRLVLLMLPEDASAAQIILLRSAAGMAYLISLLSLAVFLIALRLTGWPSRNGAFNFWVNLPTFDPTAGGDVVDRLERDARINIVLGFALPFLMPVIVDSASSLFGTVSLSNPQTLIWTVTAWAFLPASLFMRGIAMGRIATMISRARRLNAGSEKPGALQPA